MPVVTALAEGSASFDIGSLVSGMATECLSAIASTMTALTPVITAVVVIGFAIRLFKKYCK